MDPPCPLNACDVYEGADPVPFERTAEIKAENYSHNIVEDPTSSKSDRGQQIDDIERADFEEENRILKHCSGMIVDGKIATTAHYSGNLSSGSSSLASSSETISSLSNITPSGYSLPGCSKDRDDCSATIQSIIPSRNYVHEQNADFMQKLLNDNTEDKKDFPKGKLYIGDKIDVCENDEACEMDHVSGPSVRTSSNASSIGSSSSDSTKEFCVPSTSNAEKLLGLDDTVKNEPGSSKSSNYNYCDGEEDSEDEVTEESWCTCLSSHEESHYRNTYCFIMLDN